MTFFSSTSDLPTPTMADAAGLSSEAVLAAGTTGVILARVGPWSGFNDGDTVQILGGFGDQVLGSAQVAAPKSFLGGKTKVDTVQVPVVAADLRKLGTGAQSIKARWVHKDGREFGEKVSGSLAVQVQSAA